MICKPEYITEEESNIKGSKSNLSNELIRLKSSVNKAINQREHLPQPLFWSLFNSKIKELREQKEDIRRVEDLLSKIT